MKYLRYIVFVVMMVACSAVMSAQPDKKDVRRGNRQFRKGDYVNADLSYRMGLAKDSTSFAAAYNLANTAYMQGDYEGAGKLYSKIEGVAIVEGHGFEHYFNMGDNAAATENWSAAVKAFRQAMILDPENLEAKENYIYAKKKLDEQISDKESTDKESTDKESDGKDREKTDPDQNGGKDIDDSKYIDDPDADKAQDEKDSDRSRNDKSDQKNRQSQGMSGNQASQILQAIQAKESDTQDKVKKNKAVVLQARSRKKEKNW
ncbi:MAG: hypothetical protein J5520_04555 [Bacteroidales bacterium]|nr:hypothetical protein [Bacteroidales bacterium]